MAEPTPEVEFVDVNHKYVTDHEEADFQWSFDGDKSIEWAGAVVGSIIDHALHGGPQHAIDLVAVQSGVLLTDLMAGTQVPVMMMMHGNEDDKGYTPVAILLVANDKLIDIAHTMGNLIDDDGVHPALPSRMSDEFYSPPVKVDDSIDPITGMPRKVPPTTVMDLLAAQREDDGLVDP